jgi:hypothetical protein
MPQVFWVNSHEPGRLLEQVIAQFKRVYPVVPIIPTGPACEENGWRPTPAEIREFLSAAKELGLDGAHFWLWDYAGTNQGSDLWRTVSGYSWAGDEIDTNDLVSRFFQALNRSDIDAIIQLYESDGVLITRQRTLRGSFELRDYYTNLMDGDFAGGRFTVDKRESRDNTELVTWSGSSSSPAQMQIHGQDTIGLREGRIQYHTSLYEITP